MSKKQPKATTIMPDRDYSPVYANGRFIGYVVVVLGIVKNKHVETNKNNHERGIK